MNAPLLLMLAVVTQAPPPGRAPLPQRPPISSALTALPDGKVSGLNEVVFSTLQAIKKRNPGPLAEVDAYSITSAVLQPEKVRGDAPPPPAKIDAVERDLLEELSSPLSRRITVTLAGSPQEQLVLFSATGKAREILKEALYPMPDFEREWLLGISGFQVIVNDYKNVPARQKRIVTFVQGKLAMAWVASTPTNDYKPLRNEIAERTSYADALGPASKLGRTLIYKAMQALDKAESDRIPDSLYDRLKPR